MANRLCNMIHKYLESVNFPVVATLLMLLLVSLIGDKLVFNTTWGYSNAIYFKYVLDNATHNLIAALSWVLVLLILTGTLWPRANIWQAVLCGIIASALDIDHFIAFEAETFTTRVSISIPSQQFGFTR